MRRAGLLLSPVLAVVLVALSARLIVGSFANQRDKDDYAELNHVKYGLLSVDAWKRQIASILAAEIDKLRLTRVDERELKKHLEVLLSTLIDEVSKKIRASHAGSVGGWIEQTFIDTFVDLDDIKKGIPEYADALMKDLATAQTRAQIDAMLRARLDAYLNETFGVQDRSRLDAILARTGTKSITGARAVLAQTLVAERRRIDFEALLLVLLALVPFALSVLGRASLSGTRYVLLVVTLVVLLAAGVTMPMIDLEAQISELSFELLGHPVHFENQVLYFQTKSILDVFRIMIGHHDIPSKLVGVLMITFSIIIPFAKIVSTMVAYFDLWGARRHRVVEFFVFKSGKWSMADVMVVAIFMAYIGFNGVVESQFHQLHAKAQGLRLLTTNGTALQPGYFLFLTYVLLALLLSVLLSRRRSVQGTDWSTTAAPATKAESVIPGSRRELP